MPAFSKPVMGKIDAKIRDLVTTCFDEIGTPEQFDAFSMIAEKLPVRSIASTPLYSNTTMVAFLPVLLAGGCVRVMGKFDCAKWLGYAQADRTTITMLVPVQYQRLMARPEFDSFDTSSLQTLLCAGSPLRRDTKREVLRRFGNKLIELYGFSEGQ